MMSICAGGRFIAKRELEYVNRDSWSTANHSVIQIRLGDQSR